MVSSVLPPHCQSEYFNCSCGGSMFKRKRIVLHVGVSATFSRVALHCATKSFNRRCFCGFSILDAPCFSFGFGPNQNTVKVSGATPECSPGSCTECVSTMSTARCPYTHTATQQSKETGPQNHKLFATARARRYCKTPQEGSRGQRK